VRELALFSPFRLATSSQPVLPGQVLRRWERRGCICGGCKRFTIFNQIARVNHEEALESLLANLVICLQSLLEINSLIVTANGQAASLAGGLKSVSGLANEICGDCVPHSYAPALKERWIRSKSWRARSHKRSTRREVALGASYRQLGYQRQNIDNTTITTTIKESWRRKRVLRSPVFRSTPISAWFNYPVS
jgi:hypothetical protein